MLPQRDLGLPVFRFQALVALLLSSQTRDETVSAAVRNLQAAPGGLTVQSVAAMEDAQLNACISKVGFHNNKTKYLKATARALLDEHGGDVPKTAAELCALPGIGPKMAYIVLSIAHGIVDGIGVDTHMHRIFNQLDWVASKTPEQTRKQLEGWLPREHWPDVNVLFVGFGQELQTRQASLLLRAARSARPSEALALCLRLGCKATAHDRGDKAKATALQLAANAADDAAVAALSNA